MDGVSDSNGPASAPSDVHRPQVTTVDQQGKKFLDSESDWEYEYDENETETFYFNLELSTVPEIPYAKPRKEAVPAGHPSAANEDDLAGEGANGSGPHDGLDDQVQILGLHTPEPIISFRNQIYRCEWSTSVSSSLFFTAHDPSTNMPMLRRTPGYDLLAISSMRLSATPAQLFPKVPPRLVRDNVFAQGETAVPVEKAWPAIPKDKPAKRDRNPSVAAIQLDPGVDSARKAQASFLERFSKLKRDAGETDEVTIIAKKAYTGTGWRVAQRVGLHERLRALEARADVGDEDAVSQLQVMYTPRFKPPEEKRIDLGRGSRGGGISKRRGRGRPARSGMKTLFQGVAGMPPQSWDPIVGWQLVPVSTQSARTMPGEEGEASSSTPRSERQGTPVIESWSIENTENAKIPDRPS